MAITFSIALDVPALPDNDTWFANAAAWTNYWRDIDVEGELDAIVTTTYVPSAYVAGQDAPVLDFGGIQYTFPTKAQHDSLVAQVAALDAIVQAMRTQMKNAGLITEAQ